MADIYRYPYKAFTDTTDYLQIDVVRYKSIQQISGSSITGSPRSRDVNQGLERLETILLPIPLNVSDNNAVRYGESNLNSIAGAAVGAIAGTMEAGKDLSKGLGEGAKSVADELVKGAKNVATKAGGVTGVQGFVTRALASQAAGIVGANISADQILARTRGEILNPNLELLFGGPTLRSFRFQYKMTPRSQKEGEEIKKIIRCFKRNMAAKVEGTAVRNVQGNEQNTSFLRTPNVFELRYRQGAGEHKYLHRFKQCFLESINVNYTGEGVYSTYEDGTPVSMVMNLSFKEIEPIYEIDQESAGGVGY